jgi:aspartokinase
LRIDLKKFVEWLRPHRIIFYQSCCKQMTRKLQVMKFGGTSVGDAACMRRSATIVSNASREFSIAVVVSAMSGVTNRLIDAAHQAKRGDREAGKALANALRKQHFEALAALVPDESARFSVQQRIEEILSEGARLYEGPLFCANSRPAHSTQFQALANACARPFFRLRSRKWASRAFPSKR